MKRLLYLFLLLPLVVACLFTPPAKSQSGGSGTASSFYKSTFAALATPTASSVRYCTNCSSTAPCTGGGSGAFAYRVGSVWNCNDGSGSTPGADTALSNLAAVAINTSLLPGTSDGAALGSTTKMFSDLFLASGGVINFNDGDVTLTHSADQLTLGGGSLQIPDGGIGLWTPTILLIGTEASNGPINIGYNTNAGVIRTNPGTTWGWADAGMTRLGAASIAFGNGTTSDFTATIKAAAANMGAYNSITNCSDSAGAAACGAAPAGSVVIDAGSTSVVVSTTAVTANSQVFVQYDSSLGTRLSVTCNTTPALPVVTARTAATSFTITIPAAPVTNPACYSYFIVN